MVQRDEKKDNPWSKPLIPKRWRTPVDRGRVCQAKEGSTFVGHRLKAPERPAILSFVYFCTIRRDSRATSSLLSLHYSSDILGLLKLALPYGFFVA